MLREIKKMCDGRQKGCVVSRSGGYGVWLVDQEGV